MTIGLTYNNDLSRVQIALSSLTVDTVRIERSVNEVLWETIRGGVELPVSSGAANIDDFEFAADVQNFYRVLDVADDSVEESDDITPSLAGVVWLKSIRYPFLNRAVATTDYGPPSRPSRSGRFGVAGRSNPIAVSDVRGSRAFTLEFMTETLAAARDMDLILASGQAMFVHVPADCPVPGGYVDIDTTAEARRSTRGPRRYFALPCTVVAPPGPDVVPTNLTWGTVRNLYGSWEAIRTSNPTWGDLLDTVGSPDDLVVL
jgi:hypothetical protein